MGFLDSLYNIINPASANFAGSGAAEGLTRIAAPSALSTFSNVAKDLAGPAAIVGSQIYGAKKRSDMAKDVSRGQQTSYDTYMNTINPPPEVKAARFEELKGGVLDQAPRLRKQASNVLASRGIRGQGAAAPVVETEENIQDAINDAFFNIYGQYNVPSGPGPVNFAPSTMDLLGTEAGDLGMLLAIRELTKGN